jgi:hypothetical protein
MPFDTNDDVSVLDDKPRDATDSNGSPESRPSAPPPGSRRGPKTPEGKGRSSMNAIKHGKYAKLAPVLKLEDPRAFRDHLDFFVQRFQPADPIEYQLACELASIDWRMNRIIAVGTRSLDLQVRIQDPQDDFQRFRLSQLAAATRKLADDSAVLQTLTKQEQALVRNRREILETLIRMREKQPTQKRIHIPNPDNYLDSETIPNSISPGPQTNSQTNSNDSTMEPAQ